MRFSTTWLFYRRGWQGINIEPNPDSMSLFRLLRRRDKNLSVGVSDTPGQIEYYCFNEPALNTFDKGLAAEREAKTPYRVERVIQVSSERLDAILTRHLPQGTHIDFLNVDAEGYDLAVLRSNDWEKFRPTWVLAETLGRSLEQVLDCDVFRFMNDRGYELFAKTFNTSFFRDRGAE